MSQAARAEPGKPRRNNKIAAIANPGMGRERCSRAPLADSMWTGPFQNLAFNNPAHPRGRHGAARLARVVVRGHRHHETQRSNGSSAQDGLSAAAPLALLLIRASEIKRR